MPRADGGRDPGERVAAREAARRRGVTAPGGGQIVPFGDDAVLVDLGEPAGIAAARRAQALALAVEALRDGDPRLGAPVPGSASVLVPFDATAADTAAIAARLHLLLADLPVEPAPPAGARDHEITVRYGGDDGPDLEASAALAGLTPAAVVALHASVAYEVLFLGFAPGFAYLGELPDALRLPRLATPRTRVPAGSVAIAGGLTAVYPQASPGGWRILGRADVRLFDPAAESPALLRPGDRVRFVPG